MQWSKGALVGAAPSTCIRTEKDSWWIRSCRLICQQQALMMSRRSYHVYKYVWNLSQKLINHRWMFFRGMPNFLSFSGTERCTAFASRCTGINRLDICGLLTISRYMHVVLRGHSPCLLASGHCFLSWHLFRVSPYTGRLTVSSLSMDLKEATT